MPLDIGAEDPVLFDAVLLVAVLLAAVLGAAVLGAAVVLAAVPPDEPQPARNSAPAAVAPMSPIVLRFTDTPSQAPVRA